MPYPNEHSARLKNPGDFKEQPDWAKAGQKFARKADGTIYGRIKVPATADVIWGQLKTQSGKQAAPQAIRFPTKDWTAEEARKWLKDNDVKHIAFEAAKAEASASLSYMIEAQALEDGSIDVSGMAYGGGVIRVFGWGRVAIDLAGLTIPEQIPLLADHENRTGSVLGHLSASVVNHRLMIRGQITSQSATARGIVEQDRRGTKWSLSVDVESLKWSEVAEGAEIVANGQTLVGPFTLLSSGVLRAVSVVAVAADGGTKLAIAASFCLGEHDMDKDKTSGAVPPADGAGEDKTKEEAARMEKFKADIEAARAEGVKAEKERVAAIQTVCGEEFPKIAVEAIQAGWTVEATKDKLLEEIRKSRAQRVDTTRRDEGVTAEILAAAACLSQGLPEKQLLADYGEKVLNQADKFRRVGLRKFAEIAARMAQVELPLEVDAGWVRAAFSTTALPGILGAVANKALAASFKAVRQIAPRISRKVSHSNFHAHRVYSLSLSGDLEEVGPRGDLKSLSLGEEYYTRALATRGAVLSISRQDLINDELGAFTENAQRLGRKAALSRERAAALLLNGTGAGVSFFTAANRNYFEGATTNLQLSSLSTAVQMFRDQTGPDGDPVGIEPKILLTPTALEEIGKTLMDRAATILATSLGSTSSRKVEALSNVWAGTLEPIAWEWLSKTIAGVAGSSTAWYLLADPADVSILDIAYLNGDEEPTIEFFGLGQEVATLGVSWRVYWDFGANLAEYRAGVKSKGTS